MKLSQAEFIDIDALRESGLEVSLGGLEGNVAVG
jgi:hypothetical protein